MLTKKSKGVRALQKCEECGKKFKVLYDSFGKKICKECLKKETEDMEVSSDK